MKKLFALSIVFVLVSTITTACSSTSVQKQNIIQSKRRFAQYIEPQEQKAPNTIDLSEGPKLNYNRHVGPQNINFDIKIINPYW